MNPIQEIKKAKIHYEGTQNSILKYMSMRKRMGKPVVTVEEIMNFFPTRITRKDTLIRSMKTLVKHNFIKEKDKGYIITNIGKEVPTVVANSHQQQMARLGKRINNAHDWED
jgi:hypothetical protein